LTTAKDRAALLITDASGAGRLLLINSEGKYEGDGGACELPGITALTSLAGHSGEILAAAGGKLVRFTAKDNSFREAERMNSWGKEPTERFGDTINAAADADHLWIADTARHRVLCFDAATRKLLATFGNADQAGSDLLHLDRPTTIAARGTQAVVFDSANQRLIKLELAL
jgi:hypothetical protein